MIIKQRTCKYCKKRFKQVRVNQLLCSDECGINYAIKLAEKRAQLELKQQRKEDREKKEKLKRPQKWFDECKKIAQEIARIRDRHDGCISCDKPANWHGQWHGSHFRPAGNRKAIALNLWNIHKSCSECNNFKSGNLTDFETNLVKKIGHAKVSWLKSQNQPHTHTVEYLIKYKRVMGKRLLRLKKRLR